VFHSPTYRTRYAEFLKIDFPRLPLTSSLELFRALAKHGGELVALHLMESPKLEKYITKYAGKGDSEVAKGYPKFVSGGEAALDCGREATALGSNAEPSASVDAGSSTSPEKSDSFAVAVQSASRKVDSEVVKGYPKFVSGGEAALDCGREATALGSNAEPSASVDAGSSTSPDRSDSFAVALQSASRRGRVHINPECWFEGVPENVWNFHIGGYQVCEKWLKDRRGRVLSEEDIAHYQKIVVALKETIRLMVEIDKVIEAHGGWTGAFATPTSSTTP